jgi:gamma-D-glutamyl-L-lysine dipeptidyl-peptidase
LEHGICKLSLVPVRSEPSDKSELTTQLLFGECYQTISHQEKWVQIQIADDQYVGWIDRLQHFKVTPEYFEEWVNHSHPRSVDIGQSVSSPDARVPVLQGSFLPFFDGISIRVGEEKLVYHGRASNTSFSRRISFLTKIALSYLRAPYLWGGKSMFGIDCSGLVQQVYGICGYALPRDAWQQVSVGEEVHFATLAQPGDLAFFDNAEGRIVHVGIVLGEQQIIHAHGEVRIDQLDHQGIYNLSRKRYSHQLRIIKRLIV